MKICKNPQGTDEWQEDRTGVITGSMYSETRKRMKSGATKGDFSSAAHKYARRLAAERLTRRRLDEDRFETWAMRRGRELEPEVRLKHEQDIGELVEQVGLIKTDDEKFGVSLDGLIDEDGVSEYKCFIDPDKVFEIIMAESLEEIMDQMQGALWVTGRKWCDFVLYCPPLESIGLDYVRYRVERDDDYIEALEADLWEFDKLVGDYQKKLLARAAELRGPTQQQEVEQTESEDELEGAW